MIRRLVKFAIGPLSIFVHAVALAKLRQMDSSSDAHYLQGFLSVSLVVAILLWIAGGRANTATFPLIQGGQLLQFAFLGVAWNTAVNHNAVGVIFGCFCSVLVVVYYSAVVWRQLLDRKRTSESREGNKLQ